MILRALAVVTIGLTAATHAGEPPTVVLSVVGTTDLHGRIDAEDGRGGLELLGGYLDNLRAARAADGGAVVLLDTGDTYQGGISSNLSEGAVVIDAYNALGYTALAVGNHDFEYGAVDVWSNTAPPGGADLLGALKARAAQARFPFLAANLIDSAAGRPVDWPNVRPSAMVEAAGIRIGIVGVMTLDALSMTLAANVRGLAVTPLAEAIVREATALRAAGAQVVIVASHAGGVCEAFDDPADPRACYPTAEMFEVAGRLPRGLVDAIVAGHTHAAVAHLAHGIPMVQALYLGTGVQPRRPHREQAHGRRRRVAHLSAARHLRPPCTRHHSVRASVEPGVGQSHLRRPSCCGQQHRGGGDGSVAEMGGRRACAAPGRVARH